METKHQVVVVGGGTAGLVAAIASARTGVDTLLLEQRGFVGGLAAIGMTLGGFRDKAGNPVVTGLAQEIVDRAVAAGGGLGHFSTTAEDRWITSLASVDPEVLKLVGQQMLNEAGCRMLFYATVIGVLKNRDRVIGVEVFSRGKRWAIEADVLVDATGDGDVAALAGATCETGDDHGLHQAVSSIFRISNVDLPKFVGFMNQTLNTEHRQEWSISDAPTRSGWRYWLPWRDAGRADLPNTCGIYYHGNQGDIFVNTTHVDVADTQSPGEISRAAVELREQAFQVLAYLKTKVPGFEASYISYVHDVGVRDSRRVQGDYILTLDDLIAGTHFPDVVAGGAYPPDVHRHFGEVNIDQQNNVAYEIPYRCLLPVGVEGLLVVGRCISATFPAQAGIRGMGPCMSMGEAGGVAAALSAREGILPRALPVAKVQQTIQRASA